MSATGLDRWPWFRRDGSAGTIFRYSTGLIKMGPNPVGTPNSTARSPICNTTEPLHRALVRSLRCVGSPAQRGTNGGAARDWRETLGHARRGDRCQRAPV